MQEVEAELKLADLAPNSPATADAAEVLVKEAN